MSGKPYPEGVTKIVASLARCEVLYARIQELNVYAEELKAAQVEYRTLSSEVDRALDSMDLQEQGNRGFGGRMGWFIAEMRRQIVTEVEGRRRE